MRNFEEKQFQVEKDQGEEYDDIFHLGEDDPDSPYFGLDQVRRNHE